MPTVKEIVKEYLIANGYDGLISDYCTGCNMDKLIICDSVSQRCEAGYVDYPKDCDCLYHIYPGKRPQ